MSERLFEDDTGTVLEDAIEKELAYVVRSTADAEQLKILVELNRRYVPTMGWDISDARKLLISKTGNDGIMRRLKNAPHILVKALIGENRYHIDNAEYILKYLEQWFSGSVLSTDIAVKEKQEVVDVMAREYSRFIKNTKQTDIDKWSSEIKSVEDLVKYSKEIMDGMYMDALLVFLQQYSIVNSDIYVVTKDSVTSKFGNTGFSLAYMGDPGTGKTFSTDDLLRGNSNYNIPQHGMIGKLRYAEGMTPKQFIAILEAYQDYPADWIIPEFRDFFRYQGMVEKLKLVMERREVSDETRTMKIGPYTVTSFFVVNYNLKLTRTGYRNTMSDPNFAAVEDRMICKLFINTREREEQIFSNKLRMGRGEVDFHLADTLKKHMTYTYHYMTKEKIPLYINYSTYQELGEWLINIKSKYAPHTSLRILDRALQVAASSALVKALHTMGPQIDITDTEVSIAKQFIEEELMSRAHLTSS